LHTSPQPISASVEVVFDPEDDLDIMRQLRGRYSTSGARVVAMPPNTTSTRTVIWTILHSLGKRKASPWLLSNLAWIDVARWLYAHGVHTLVVLCCQHVSPETLYELEATITGFDVSLILVYARDCPDRQRTTIATLMDRPQPPVLEPPDRDPWPEVPRSHPLRFRHDCEQTLNADEFARVEHLLADTHEAAANWLVAPFHRAPDTLATAVAVLGHAQDPNQRYIRHCAIEIAIASDGLAVPECTRLQMPDEQDDSAIDAALIEIEPEHAAFLLVEALTGLHHSLIRLMGGDQIQNGHVLGVPLPSKAWPVQHALASGARLRPPPGYDYGTPAGSKRLAGSESPPNAEFRHVLARLLNMRRQREPGEDLTQHTLDRLDNLASLGIVDQHDGVYRLSRVAAYSSFLPGHERPSSFTTLCVPVASRETN
jgi:hypothetical protein